MIERALLALILAALVWIGLEMRVLNGAQPVASAVQGAVRDIATPRREETSVARPPGAPESPAQRSINDAFDRDIQESLRRERESRAASQPGR